MPNIITINKDFPGLTGRVVGVLPITKFRPKELFRIEYDNGKFGLLESTDFQQKETFKQNNNEN